jgi:hypothetical protein
VGFVTLIEWFPQFVYTGVTLLVNLSFGLYLSTEKIGTSIGSKL